MPKKRWVYVRSIRNANITSRRGNVVHASDRDGYPECGRYMYGIVYTADSVNCPKCLRGNPT